MSVYMYLVIQALISILEDALLSLEKEKRKRHGDD